MVTKKKNNVIQVLLQKRSSTKEAFPRCYDISSAGHIPAGEDFESSAIRKLREELGITANKKNLIFCGDRNIIWNGIFNKKPFYDRQHSKVFMMWLDLEEDKFILDHTEVESVTWIDLLKCIEGVKNNSFKHYIAMEELEILCKALKIDL